MSSIQRQARPEPREAIIRLRGQAVILDSDLAALYGVTVKRLNEQMKRNQKRFPEDFCFQLTLEETQRSRSQFATASTGRIRSQFATALKRNIRYCPYAFTEHGAIMAANVLRSERAEEMSVAVVRAFVSLRRMALSVEGLARKVAALENKYDASFSAVFDAIRDLMEPPAPPRKRIGFQSQGGVALRSTGSIHERPPLISGGYSATLPVAPACGRLCRQEAADTAVLQQKRLRGGIILMRPSGNVRSHAHENIRISRA